MRMWGHLSNNFMIENEWCLIWVWDKILKWKLLSTIMHFLPSSTPPQRTLFFGHNTNIFVWLNQSSFQSHWFEQFDGSQLILWNWRWNAIKLLCELIVNLNERNSEIFYKNKFTIMQSFGLQLTVINSMEMIIFIINWIHSYQNYVFQFCFCLFLNKYENWYLL